MMENIRVASVHEQDIHLPVVVAVEDRDAGQHSLRHEALLRPTLIMTPGDAALRRRNFPNGHVIRAP